MTDPQEQEPDTTPMSGGRKSGSADKTPQEDLGPMSSRIRPMTIAMGVVVVVAAVWLVVTMLGG